MSARIRVLLAEDQNCSDGKIEASLRNHPAVELLDVASTGVQAIDCIRRYRVELLLLDLVLPEMDGISVLREMRKLDLYKEPMVVICTALSSERIINEAAHLGAVHCLLKPANPDWIVQRMLEIYNTQDVVVSIGQRLYSASDLLHIVVKIIHEIGIPPHLTGYDYLKKGILESIRYEKFTHAVTTKLYPRLATEYNTTPQRVERSIRHAIEATWNRGDIVVLEKLFGYTVKDDRGRPTNSEFIARVVDLVMLRCAGNE